ncbi:hypothetical protein [Calothrix sp. UHCC 0171]|uniref:hypothetical protein n=1 Tax=Calothrix sp. UHCC 0171 TaxID=3110245 RepID=UPI002B1F2336|nr:hypothetical protein [Calothrix sp. UHCC 0171]MEA5574207.1 hypothetical protein [Calothrix sp. UHCC 0171]
MSYASFLKNIPEVLSQPTGIAALASLGIHGAIAFILPLMPVQSSKSAKEASTTPKAVGLTQLTPAEQSRLPQQAPLLQPSIQAQLPPLPGQISSLPAQQQLPLSLPNTISGLPPAPPPGSTALSLPPLGRTPNFSVSSLPRSNSLSLSRRDLFINPNFSSNPGSSVNISRLPRSSRINTINSDIAFGSPRQITPSNLPEPPVTPSANFPVAPPPLSSELNTSTGDDVAAAIPSQSENPTTVTPDQFIAPVDNTPQSTGGNYTLAAQPVTQFPAQSGGINQIATTSSSTDTTAQPNNPIRENTPVNVLTATGAVKKISMLDAFSEAKKQYPELEFSGAPIRLTMPPAQLERNVEVAVRMDRENKIDSVQLLGDGISIPSASKLAIKERLLQYVNENPVAVNGKAKLFTFRISPDGAASNDKPAENKPANSQLSTESDRKLPTQPENTPASVVPQDAPTKPENGLQLNNNKPVIVPQVNTPRPNSTLPAVNQPANEVSPVRENRPVPPKLPNFKPKEAPSPLDKVEPAPPLPIKPANEQPKVRTQPIPTRPISAQPLIEKLRDSKNQSSSAEENTQQTSVIQKLRQFKQEEDNTQP